MNKSRTNIVIFDEAKHLMPRHREDSSQRSICPMTTMIGLVREFNVGLIAAENEPRQLADSMKANAYTTICMSLSHGKDKEDAAASMGLPPEQKDEISKLEAGQAIVRMAGRYTDPFVIDPLPLEVDKQISDEEIQARMAPHLERLQKTCRFPEEQATQEQDPSSETKKSRAKTELLKPREKKVFRSICEAPDLSIPERMEKVDLDRDGELACRRRLTTLGLIEEAGSAGRNFVLFQPTLKGEAYAKDHGFSVKKMGGSGGGPVHSFILRQTEISLSKFYPSISFQRTGIYFSSESVRLDSLAKLPGAAARRAGIQVFCGNKREYEAQALVRLIDLIEEEPVLDVVLSVSANKRKKESLESRVQEIIEERMRRENPETEIGKKRSNHDETRGIIFLHTQEVIRGPNWEMVLGWPAKT